MKKRIKISILSILFLFGIVVIFSYLIWSSYNNLQVNHFSIETTTPGSSLNLVVLADLHDNTLGRANETLVSKVEDANSDLIFMVGDMLNADSSDAQPVYSLVSQLSEFAPVYYALGNHELEYMENHPEFLLELQQAGAIFVDKSYADVEICGKPLRIGGLYDYAFALDGNDSTNPENMDPEVYQYLTDFQNTDRYKIMLSHRPESFVLGEASKTWEIDLVISGHVHGGQVVLPFLGGLWAPEQGYFPDYVHGWYEKDKLSIFITSGLGSDKQKLPRFNNPPEIAVMKLL